MKLILSMALAIIFTISTANAQTFNFGAKAGLNLYNISSDAPNYDSDSKIGFHVGLLSHLHLSDQWGLQLEAIYSAQGAKNTVGGVDFKTNLSYINVPLLLQYFFDNGFRIQAGPQLGLLISAKDQDDVSFKDNVNSIDLGLSLGASYVHVPSGFGVDARYNLGLSDINNNDATTFTLKNNGFQVGVFYLFIHQD